MGGTNRSPSLTPCFFNVLDAELSDTLSAIAILSNRRLASASDYSPKPGDFMTSAAIDVPGIGNAIVARPERPLRALL
jgi:hypothetical protein